MSFGNSQEALKARRFLNEGEVEISERAFNLLIGGVLLWGFLLNYAMVALFSDQIVHFLSGAGFIPFLIGYIVLVLIGSALIARPNPVLSFVGYNLIAVPIGLLLCVALTGVSTDTIRTAILLTAIITLSFMIVSMIFSAFFLSLGRVLLFSLLFTMLGELFSLIFFRGRSLFYEWIYAGIFSLYIGYDWARANTCARTVNNAIDLSASLYLDIINLFLRLVEILSRHRD